MGHGPLTDIAICIVAAWLFGVVAQVLRQPPLLAYLVAGYVIGPNGLKIVTDQSSIDSISVIGLLLLLFVIGLEIDLKQVLGSGKAIVVTGIVQIAGTFVLALAILRAWHLPEDAGRFAPLYLAIASFASSTVVAVKLLADKSELGTLAGRLAIGVSVLQDISVITFLGMQPALDKPGALTVVLTFVKIGAMISIALGASRYVLPTLFHRVATLPELVVVGALAWCFVIAALAERLGLSREMGALVAGVALSTFPYHLDVTAKLASLRDFFITLFFVGLGLTVPAPDWAPVAGALAFSGFIIASRLLTVMAPLQFLRMGNRVSFVTSLNLLPLSEFSLVLITLGVTAGHLSKDVLAPVVYSFFFLAILGSYAISGSDRLFLAVDPWLRRAGLRDRPGTAEPAGETRPEADVFLLGFHATASTLLEELERQQPQFLPRLAVIDFNPEVHRRLARRGIRAIWGDISQRDTLEQAGLRRARIIVCTLPNIILRGTNNLRLVQTVRALNREAMVIAHAERLSDVAELRAAGADYVSLTRLIEADTLVSVLEAAEDRLLHDKAKTLETRIEKRSEVVP